MLVQDPTRNAFVQYQCYFSLCYVFTGNRKDASCLRLQYTTIPRSPFFAFRTKKYCRLQTLNKMRSNICANEMALFRPFAAFVKGKHSLTIIAKNEVCPRDEIADPPGTAVLPIDRHGFDEGLVPFRTLCGVQSSLVGFNPN